MKKFISTLSAALIMSAFLVVPSQAQSLTDYYQDYSYGSKTAPLKMDIWHDFQCPFCRQLHQNTIQTELIQDYVRKGLLEITYRDFPLSFHPQARAAATAANAVRRMEPNLYPLMVDLLFDNQQEWSVNNPLPVFQQYARDLGLLERTFAAYTRDPNNINEINADITEGERMGISATPSYTINGTIYAGAVDDLTVKKQLDEALKVARTAPTSSPPQMVFGNEFKLELESDLGQGEVFLTTGDTIEFEIFASYPSQFEVSSVNWTTDNLADVSGLDCFVLSGAEDDQSCTAVSTGKAAVYATVNFFDGRQLFTLDTNRITVTIDDPFMPVACPAVFYPEPECPNGTIYSPPAANGCPGPPICKTDGSLFEEPLAGYEDEVRVRFELSENPFGDNNINNLTGKAAAELFYRGIIGGFPDGEFKGSRPVNRAEASKFLLLARGHIIPTVVRDNPFDDVIASEWYGPFVVQANKLGILFGYGDNTFRPGNNVQRDEFLAMMARTFDLPTGLPHSFTDTSINPNAWYWDYAGIASLYDLFPGERTLKPSQTMTRAEVAIAIYQYLRNRE